MKSPDCPDCGFKGFPILETTPFSWWCQTCQQYFAHLENNEIVFEEKNNAYNYSK